MPPTIDAARQGPALATELDRSQESHIDLLHRAAIGPVNLDYYLPILRRFETYDRATPSWNWAASLCTLNWMAFRGLWGPALFYVGIMGVAALSLVALTQLAVGMAASIQWGLWAALATLGLLVPGFFGNSWLFRHQRHRLAAALADTPTLNDACMALRGQASSRQRLVALMVANTVLAAMLMTAWFWPGRALRDTARIDEGPVGIAAAPRSASLARAPANTASQPSDPALAAAPALPTDAATRPVVAAPARAVSQPAAPPAGIAASTPPASELLSQTATRHAAIAARSRHAHQRATPQTASADPAEPAGSAASATPLKSAGPAASAARVGPAAPATEGTAVSGRFQVNVGLFAEDDNAQRTFSRLTQAGLAATMEPLQRNTRMLTRIRVGPFTSREQADAAAQAIRALQLEAVVTGP